MAINPYQEVIDGINAILADPELESTVEAVVNRLVSFGYEPTTSDAWIIAFSIQKTQNHILNQTAQAKVPAGLFYVFTDNVCGEFLSSKYASGQLDLSGLDMDGMISSIREGDTTVEFDANGSDESKLRQLIQGLMHEDGDILCYRKLRW